MIPSNSPFSFGLEKDPQSFVVIPEEDSIMSPTGSQLFSYIDPMSWSYAGVAFGLTFSVMGAAW